MDALKQKFDPENLHQVIMDLPEQITKAWNFTDAKIKTKIEKIFIFGMGGSALPADILKAYLKNSDTNFNLPIEIIRDYDLPKNFDSQSAGIFISYSGNTEETLNCLEQALKTPNKNLVVIATGGKLEQLAKSNDLQTVKIPTDCLQPRMGYGYFFGALIKILANSGFFSLDEKDLSRDIETLVKNNQLYEKTGQDLAKSLEHKLPIIYTSQKWQALAMIIKINFNENTKIQSFWNSFPEMNHNEMVGYTNLITDYKVIIFQDPEDNERTKKRMAIFHDIFQKKLAVQIIEMPTESNLIKIFSTLLIGLWSSYYLALINKINPVPVELVEKFKKLMAE